MTLNSPTVFHTFSSTICMEKKGKNEIGTEGWHGVKKNPTQIWTYLCEILLNSFPTELASDTQPLRLLKMIYNTKT